MTEGVVLLLKGFLRSPNWKKRLLLAGLAFVFLVALIGSAWAGKNVVLVIDGKPYYLKTKAKTVGELLEENNLTLKRKDFIKPGINESIRDGLKVTIIKAKKIRLVVDGKSTEVELAALRVKDVLEKLNIAYEPSRDEISPRESSLVYPGLEIKINHLIVKIIKLKTPVPFKVLKTVNPRLSQGKKIIKFPGEKGLAVQTFKVTYLGGKEIARKIISTKIAKKPLSRIVLVGGRKKVRPRRSYSFAARVAVARGSRCLLMWATAYVPGYGCGYRTSTGRRATYGVVAVDPRVIPLGTRLYIPGYGYAVAADTGGKIKGNRIDLCFDSPKQARRFGHRQVKVFILK